MSRISKVIFNALLIAIAIHGNARAQSRPAIPQAVKDEHEEIQSALRLAMLKPGPVGKAAAELSAVLRPHFEREEQIALPPLGLLLPFANRELVHNMAAVLPLTDSLAAELQSMLAEHKAIAAAVERLQREARKVYDGVVIQFTNTLKQHALMEEQVMYPAAILVGDLVRTRLSVSQADVTVKEKNP
jgi:hypothetical protein